MSATVTYKGATLTTATNQTRTLDTAGTYLEDDITITDVTTVPTGTKNISITANGTTTEDVTSYATASITANVPNSYSASDEGKVVSNGALVSQTSDTVTANDTYDTTLINSLTVNVSGGGISIDDLATNTAPSGDIVFNGTALGTMAFAGKPITSFVGPNVTSIGRNCFGMCSSLVSASFPVLETWDAFNFNNSSYGVLASLESLNIPNVKDVKAQTFTQMPMLTKVILPSLQTTNANSFNTTGSGITTIDIGKNLNTLSGYAFNGASNALVNVILRRDDAIVSASSTNTLINNRVVNYYVPSDLIESYKVATNWSTRYSAGYANFIALENSVYKSEDWYKDD